MQLTIYMPEGMYKRIKEFSLKYNIPMTQLTLYAVEELIEKMENENVSIFDLKKEIREKIYKFYKEIHNYNKGVIEE